MLCYLYFFLIDYGFVITTLGNGPIINVAIGLIVTTLGNGPIATTVTNDLSLWLIAMLPFYLITFVATTLAIT